MGQAAISIFNLSAKAAAAIAPYRCVNYANTQTATIGGEVKGISRRPAASGEMLELACLGTATIEAGAAIAIGQALMSDALGRVIVAGALTVNDGSLAIAAGAVAVTSTAANGVGVIVGAPGILSGCELPQHLVGYALESASAAGQLIEVKLSV